MPEWGPSRRSSGRSARVACARRADQWSWTAYRTNVDANARWTRRRSPLSIRTDAPMVHLPFEILPADLSGPSLIPVRQHRSPSTRPTNPARPWRVTAATAARTIASGAAAAPGGAPAAPDHPRVDHSVGGGAASLAPTCRSTGPPKRTGPALGCPRRPAPRTEDACGAGVRPVPQRRCARSPWMQVVVRCRTEWRRSPTGATGATRHREAAR